MRERLIFKHTLNFLGLWTFLALTGCQMVPNEDPDVSSFMLAKTDNEPVFQAAKIVVEGFESGELFKQQSKFYPLIEKKFHRSGLFDLGESPYEIVVRWESWKRDRALPEIPENKSLAKWSLLESNAEMFHRMEILVKEDGDVVKRYEYDDFVYHRGRGYLDNANRHLTWFHYGVNPMLSKFFLDLKRDGYLKRS